MTAKLIEAVTGKPAHRTVEQLKNLYAELNRTRFDDRLPRTPTIRLVLPRPWESDLLAHIEHTPASIKLKFQVNLFAPAMPADWPRRMLLHELCHFGQPRFERHGALFRGKLKEAAAGEPWLAAELRQCRGRFTVCDHIRFTWLSALLSTARREPDLPLSRVLAAVALACGVKAETFTAALPIGEEALQQIWACAVALVGKTK